MTDSANRWRAAALAAASLLPLSSARAEPTLEELLQRIEQQDQKILILERKLELKEEADTSAKSSNAVVKASDKGFSLASADGQNQVRLRGVLHFDGRNFTDDVTPETDDTWLLRRTMRTSLWPADSYFAVTASASTRAANTSSTGCRNVWMVSSFTQRQ